MIRRPAVTRAPGRLWAASIGLLAAACSTLAEVEPVSSCVSDDECNAKIPGQVCGGGICYDASLPPRAAIGLDVLGSGLDSSLRVELRGDDTSTLRIDRTPIRYSVSLDDRKLDNEKIVPGVRDQLQITLSETYNSGDKDRTIALAGNLTLSQASRLGRDAVVSNPLRFELVDPMTMQALEDPLISVPWARYDRDKDGNDTPLLLAITADDGRDPDTNIQVYRGLVYRQLVRPQLPGVGTHTFAMRTRRECHRKIHGTLRLTNGGVPPSPADISFRHARRDPDAGVGHAEARRLLDLEDGDVDVRPGRGAAREHLDRGGRPGRHRRPGRTAHGRRSSSARAAPRSAPAPGCGVWGRTAPSSIMGSGAHSPRKPQAPMV